MILGPGGIARRSPAPYPRFLIVSCQAPHLPGPHSRWALFLDVDGTLLELADTPDDVVVPPALQRSLESLHSALEGAVALVSGRSLKVLDRLFAPLRLPSAGLHGLERRSAAGEVVTHEVPRAPLARARDAFGRFVVREEGTSLEDKGKTLALHYRQAPEAEGKAHDLAARLASDLGDPFHVQTGKMVVEIKSRAASKGGTIEAFLGEEPFSGRMPVFVGDDKTDEDGFAAVNRLGGISIRVGPHETTRARYRLEDVAALHAWLRGLVAAVEGRRGGAASVRRRPGG